MSTRALTRVILCLLAMLLPAATMAGEADESVSEAPGLTLAGEDDPAPTPLPSLTPEPTQTPTPEPTATPIPWFTSPRYPGDKVNFEGNIWAILTGEWGLTDVQAAGLMGCVQAESSFSPYRVEGMESVDGRGRYAFDTGDGVGFGLCQWTSSGRKDRLLAHAEANGGAWRVWDFDTQMAYWREEIRLDALKTTVSLYAATEWAVLEYERPNLRYANSWPGTRYERGKAIYRRRTGKAYVEPELECDIDSGDVPARLRPEEEQDEKAVAEATFTVRCNYYWRLAVDSGVMINGGAEGDGGVEGDNGAMVDGGAAADGGDWLTVECANYYHPDRMETCVCGYAIEGDKPLTLRFSALPAPGETWKATLRFEISRGGHMLKTVPIMLTGGERGEAPILTVEKGRMARGRL